MLHPDSPYNFPRFSNVDDGRRAASILHEIPWCTTSHIIRRLSITISQEKSAGGSELLGTPSLHRVYYTFLLRHGIVFLSLDVTSGTSADGSLDAINLGLPHAFGPHMRTYVNLLFSSLIQVLISMESSFAFR